MNLPSRPDHCYFVEVGLFIEEIAMPRKLVRNRAWFVGLCPVVDATSTGEGDWWVLVLADDIETALSVGSEALLLMARDQILDVMMVATSRGDDPSRLDIRGRVSDAVREACLLLEDSL